MRRQGGGAVVIVARRKRWPARVRGFPRQPAALVSMARQAAFELAPTTSGSTRCARLWMRQKWRRLWKGFVTCAARLLSISAGRSLQRRVTLNNKGFNFRHPTMEDAQQVLDLQVRCNIASMANLTQTWKICSMIGADRFKPGRLAGNRPHRRIGGLRRGAACRQNLRYDFYTAPTLKDSPLSQTLLDWCEGRGPGFAQQRNLPPSANIIIYLAHVNEGNRALVEQADFQPAAIISRCTSI